jgi:hypothetical protein
MAFGKKKQAPSVHVDQSNVALLATQALSTMRSSRVLTVARLTTTSPILMHRWSQKAIVQMLSKMTGLEMPRPPKDLTEEFNASWYRNELGEVVMPCRVLKAAIVEGAISTGKVVSKAELKRELRVRGFTSPIYKDGKKLPPSALKMDVQPARNQSGPDLRSRALVPSGSYMDIVLDFPPTLTPDKVTCAIDGAGSTIGLCDWRPDTGGEYGTFEVGNFRSDKATIDRVLRDCSSPEETFIIPPELLRAFRGVPHEQVSDQARKALSVVKQVNGQHVNGRGRRGGGDEVGA